MTVAVVHPRIDLADPFVKDEYDGVARLHMHATRAIRYTVYNSSRSILGLNEPLLAEVLGIAPVFLIADDAVMHHFGPQLMRYLQAHVDLKCSMTILGEESRKGWDVVEAICERALQSSLGRRAVFVGVGGGVALDIAGLAASLFRRGVPYIRIPTTLVGLVDVAVGIKHAVNFCGQKNALGSFAPPVASVVDRCFLQTLDRRQIGCGMAEIIKMAVVRDAQLFALLERDGQALFQSKFQLPEAIAEYAITRSQALMMAELQSNLFEDDLLRLVDFGHTFSCTLESSTSYRIPHGEAVAVDMLLSTALAVECGFCGIGVLHRLASLCNAVGLPLWDEACRPFAMREALEAARNHRGGTLNLVVPTDIGSATFMQSVPDASLCSALQLLQAVASDRGR